MLARPPPALPVPGPVYPSFLTVPLRYCLCCPVLPVLPRLQHALPHQGSPDQRLHRDNQVLHHLQVGAGSTDWQHRLAVQAGSSETRPIFYQQ